MRMLVMFAIMMMSVVSFAQLSQDVVPSPTAAVVQPAVAVAAPVPTPAVSPVTPPDFVVKLLTFVQGLPVVGPIVSKVVQIAAIAGSILTLLVAFLLSLLKIVAPLMSAVSADGVAAFLTAQQNSKWMYWLKYFSFFNAKTPPPPAPTVGVV
jgi:hypothetical protein